MSHTDDKCVICGEPGTHFRAEAWCCRCDYKGWPNCDCPKECDPSAPHFNNQPARKEPT